MSSVANNLGGKCHCPLHEVGGSHCAVERLMITTHGATVADVIHYTRETEMISNVYIYLRYPREALQFSTYIPGAIWTIQHLTDTWGHLDNTTLNRYLGPFGQYNT